ncbi:protein transport protein Sec24C-like [Ptychodera flava]|uniref:protein transport protein Sec24C-like n=1 Tax=Ptychodera flava TaxID=63121 RepID=UPI00396A712E
MNPQAGQSMTYGPPPGAGGYGSQNYGPPAASQNMGYVQPPGGQYGTQPPMAKGPGGGPPQMGRPPVSAYNAGPSPPSSQQTYGQVNQNGPYSGPGPQGDSGQQQYYGQQRVPSMGGQQPLPSGYGAPQVSANSMAPPPGPSMMAQSAPPPAASRQNQLTNQMSGMNISGPPQPGVQQRPMGIPPTSMAGQRPPQPGMPVQPMYSGQPPTSQPYGTTAPPGSMGGMQQGGVPLSNMGAPPPTSMTGPPPPSSMAGPPPSSMAGPPSSMGGLPPASMAGPPSQVGGYPQQNAIQPGQQLGYGGPPSSMSGPPSSMAGPPMPGGVPPSSYPSANAYHQQPQSQSPLDSPTARAPPPMGGGMPAGAAMAMGAAGMSPAHPGMMQQPQPQQTQRRLDPDQMPSPIQVIEDDRRNRGSQQFTTNQRGQVPPLVTTEFDVVDQGNASPRFVRATVYNIPCTQDMVKQSQIPIGLVITPFAKLKPNEQPPPLVDLGVNGPIRCNRCKAYMCPFMQFIDGGRRFQCSFCNCITEVPPEYFQHLDHMGRRIDYYERPELSLGSYEFVATTDYCKNNKLPNPPVFIFMIDVTYNSVKNGMVPLLCKQLRSLLDRLPKETGQDESSMRVGFVTYDKSLHFYNVNGALAQPQMLVVSDINDVFMPLLDGFLVKLSDARPVIDSLLEQIPQMFSETRETETMLGPVVQAGLEAMKAADCCGKLFVFHSSLPIAEAPGKLKNRDDRKLLGSDKEKTVLTPQGNFYSKLAQNCVAAGCSVDLFLFPNSYVDVATIGQVCTITGGQCFKYNYFQASTDGERFIYDLTRNMERPIAFDSIMRVRTSTGIRPTDFYGSMYMSNTTDIELGSIDCDKAISVEIKHDDKLQEEVGAFVQVALLYTSITGQRRLRIHNLSFNCCNQMADMFRNCEMDAVLNLLAKHAISQVTHSSPKAIRETLINQCAHILTCYRKNCASPSSPGQLILPECMKLLPLYANSLIKSDALSGGSDITTDDRSWLMQTVSAMDVASTHVYFYPRLLPLHDLDPEGTGLPAAIRCSADRLREDGVYLLENGVSMYMWIGLHVNPDWVQNVFSAQSPAQIDIDAGKLLALDNPVSVRVRGVVQQVRQERQRYMKLTVVRQRDTLEPWFKHFLCEDKGFNGGASYVDFLCHMHKEIRNMLS